MKKYLLFILFLFISDHLFAIAPIIVDSYPGNNTTICIGEQTYYTDSTPGGIWSCSDTLIAIIDTSGLATGITVGTVIITYSIGTAYVTKTVTVYPPPYPIYGSLNICQGGWTTLYDTTAGGGAWTVESSGAVYLYYGGGYSAIIYPGNVGDGGTVTFVDTAGCSTYTDVTTVGYLPPIVGDTTLYVDSTTTFHDFGFAYTWSSSDTAIATISSTGIVTGISAGNVTIYCVNGCMESANLTVLSNIVIPIQPQSTVTVNKITIFPNPVTTFLTIQSTNQPINEIQITNIIGQAVYSRQFAVGSSQTIDVSALTAGVYFVKINNTDVQKFIKE